ncbi:MAG: alpha-N-acetylglucosaminidase C-terminal domain-containing protein [Acidobacteria bacterium]|nr:alpha-N-acetylglucosaminidase C-terminal domain-containing protein [Acidobacteriota bacterium]
MCPHFRVPNTELLDYANRQWNGLMRDYHLPRWQMLLDATLTELKGGKPADRAVLEKKWREHEKQFATTTGGNYASRPNGNCFAMSRALYKKYSRLLQENGK